MSLTVEGIGIEGVLFPYLGRYRWRELDAPPWPEWASSIVLQGASPSRYQYVPSDAHHPNNRLASHSSKTLAFPQAYA